MLSDQDLTNIEERNKKQMLSAEDAEQLFSTIRALRQQNADLQFDCAWFRGHQQDEARSAEYWRNHYLALQLESKH